MVINLENLIENILQSLNPKQKRIMVKRYGLAGKQETLQEIGDVLAITRERVRQIENQSLLKIQKEINKSFGEIVDIAKNYLREGEGVEEEYGFMRNIARLLGIDPTAKNIENKIQFFFFAAGEPLYEKEGTDTKGFWHLGKEEKEKLLNYIKEAIAFFEEAGREGIFGNSELREKINEYANSSLLQISKKFGKNAFGDFGLMTWAEIKPKNVRDKAYLAIKKHGKPLHFEQIAKLIHENKISAKPVNTQTVHNELIKDKRFVLVGRGMYGLKEYGYLPGTVREVIVNLIKENGPLNSKEVVELVNQKRFLKENTILLNLQNRKRFRRLETGKYDIREA
ncbi:hypothetical protein A3A21_01520 [Candidatus Jorgensenbacteria bacterium RIFCSPLOWO2_01_FULL_45_25b]|uniref:HTH HARE-type domain-containing protein n=1 Tax=Candidatus Jorgensenbacteria bacterium RIFCSPLOWO2_01_FULL_45_25b TaxID=1798471 RepID=A0A1F6BTB0_9BACT|nr:MAG: hypothetical protein A3A21_01520 [Candidatus Jorgensenbacteria bacterium RIFCSPLOWO2_01_FULL_45_25b]